jgi:Rrf2 family cysteine metabolism transcriptional repressor
MQTSVKGEYALLAVFDLSLQPPGVPVRIAEIAKRQQIPQKFLELILASLKQGGFVQSRRGADGGYLLARPASEITVGGVLRFLEGPASGKNAARRRPDSPFKELWAEVDAAVSGIVDHRTFADLRRAWQEKQSRFIPNWEI